MELLEKMNVGPWKWDGMKFRDKNKKIVYFTPFGNKESIENAKANVAAAANAYTAFDLLEKIRQDFSASGCNDDDWMGKHLNAITEFFDKINNP